VSETKRQGKKILIKKERERGKTVLERDKDKRERKRGKTVLERETRTREKERE